MGKEVKTNAMRILDRNKIKYTYNIYECGEFIDGIQVAEKNGQPFDESYKTLVAQGKSGGYFVYVIPVDRELDLKKCAKAVSEKSVQLIPVKEITRVTGYIRGGCTPIGMKKNYPTVVYEGAAQKETIIISAGRIGEQLILAPGDLLRVTGGKYGDILQE